MGGIWDKSFPWIYLILSTLFDVLYFKDGYLVYKHRVYHNRKYRHYRKDNIFDISLSIFNKHLIKETS